MDAQTGCYHVHLLVTWGGFRPDGTFVHAPDIPAEPLEKLFQHEVLKTLLDAGAVGEDLVQNLLSWVHSGFHVHVGREIDGDDTRALEAVSEYIARGPVAFERLSVDETGPKPRVVYRASKVHPRHGTDFRSEGALEFLAVLIPHIPGTHESGQGCRSRPGTLEPCRGRIQLPIAIARQRRRRPRQ